MLHFIRDSNKRIISFDDRRGLSFIQQLMNNSWDIMMKQTILRYGNQTKHNITNI